MSLFAPDTPDGFRYREDFISAVEETELAADIAGVEFSNFEMRGVVAKRRVAFFGATYDAGDAPARPIPDFLRPLIARAAAWAGVEPGAFAMALINEYRAGAPIGWHRDAPQYHIVAGISLISASVAARRAALPVGKKVTGLCIAAMRAAKCPALTP